MARHNTPQSSLSSGVPMNTTRGRAMLAALLATVAVLVGVSAAAPDTHATYTPTIAAAQTAEPYFVSGVIKPDGTGGWYALEDTYHGVEGGLEVLSVTNTKIIVGFDPGIKILAFIVDEDEVLSGLNWTAGASIATSYAEITIGRSTATGSEVINPHLVSNIYANLTVMSRLLRVSTAPNQVCLPQS